MATWAKSPQYRDMPHQQYMQTEEGKRAGQFFSQDAQWRRERKQTPGQTGFQAGQAQSQQSPYASSTPYKKNPAGDFAAYSPQQNTQKFGSTTLNQSYSPGSSPYGQAPQMPTGPTDGNWANYATQNRPAPFTARYGQPDGSFSDSPNYNQRDAFIQALNNQQTPYMTGQRSGPPQYDVGAAWNQAGQMVQQGFQNPFAPNLAAQAQPQHPPLQSIAAQAFPSQYQGLTMAPPAPVTPSLDKRAGQVSASKLDSTRARQADVRLVHEAFRGEDGRVDHKAYADFMKSVHPNERQSLARLSGDARSKAYANLAERAKKWRPEPAMEDLISSEDQATIAEYARLDPKNHLDSRKAQVATQRNAMFGDFELARTRLELARNPGARGGVPASSEIDRAKKRLAGRPEALAVLDDAAAKGVLTRQGLAAAVDVLLYERPQPFMTDSGRAWRALGFPHQKLDDPAAFARSQPGYRPSQFEAGPSQRPGAIAQAAPQASQPAQPQAAGLRARGPGDPPERAAPRTRYQQEIDRMKAQGAYGPARQLSANEQQLANALNRSDSVQADRLRARDAMYAERGRNAGQTPLRFQPGASQMVGGMMQSTGATGYGFGSGQGGPNPGAIGYYNRNGSQPPQTLGRKRGMGTSNRSPIYI